MALVNSLGARGYLDKAAFSLSKAATSDIPVCEACRYGHQVKRPDGTTTTTKNPACVGALKKDQRQPGQQIFMDQLESCVRGCLLHTSGREPMSSRFCGTTVFCNAPSNYIHVKHQVTLNASDTINSTLSFERMARDLGVTIDSYHTDNGIFKSKAYLEKIRSDS